MKDNKKFTPGGFKPHQVDCDTLDLPVQVIRKQNGKIYYAGKPGHMPHSESKVALKSGHDIITMTKREMLLLEWDFD